MHAISKLEARTDDPISVCLIGPGVFGSHVAYQIESTPGMLPTVLADLAVEKAERTFRRSGVDADDVVHATDRDGIDAALADGKRVTTGDGVAAAASAVDVVVDTTGDPRAAAEHAWHAIEAGTHVVMVSVEVDATVGPLLQRLAADRGVNYSMGYGDEPVQVVNLVDWARASGFEVVAAGQGTELTFDEYGTHSDALERYGVTEEFRAANDPSPRMYNTFQDGTKVAIELCGAANALGLRPDEGGPHMPTTDREGLLETLRPKEDGGELTRTNVIDAVTPTEGYRNPSAFVVTRTDNDATREYLHQRYNILTANEGTYQLFDRQYHLPQETTISIAQVALENDVTGAVHTQQSEVIARAKRDLSPGETLASGEDTVYGTLADAERAETRGAVPFELLHDAVVTEPVATDEPVTEDVVDLDTDSTLFHLRQLQDELLSV
jgi:predicted homoserine dehydrogenase-like protein